MLFDKQIGSIGDHIMKNEEPSFKKIGSKMSSGPHTFSVDN